MMERTERGCPFLREEKVVLCRAYPLRKPLPCDRIYSDENLCLRPDYRRCPIYKEKEREEREGAICPFVELETVMYCELFPVKKMVPSSCYKLESPCTSGSYEQCPLYRQVAFGDLSQQGPFEVRRDRLYHPNHLWVKVRGERVRIGLDDFCQFLLGAVQEVHPPKPGERVEAGKPFLRVQAQGGEVRLPSPLSGKVERINQDLTQDPSLLNQDPYGRGWVLELLPDGNRFEEMVPGDEAEGWMEQELRRLQGLLHTHLGGTMADGGEFCKEVLQKVDRDKRELLLEEFLQKRKEG